jgi:hypothetical protein
MSRSAATLAVVLAAHLGTVHAATSKGTPAPDGAPAAKPGRTRRVIQALRNTPARVARDTRRGLLWVRTHPTEATVLGVGTLGMFATGLYVSPEIAQHVRDVADPHVGHTAAVMLGTASGGAVASGTRSLLVHAAPMITGIDPVNKKQLATDVAMSTGFNFPGFAVAEGLNLATGDMTPVARAASLFTGLIGWEMAKDFMQMKLRSRFATVPKRFRDVWKELLVMEITSNAHRIFFPTSFAAKQAGDVFGVAFYDRIVNNVAFGDKEANSKKREAFQSGKGTEK